MSLEDVPRSLAQPGRWVLSCMWHTTHHLTGGQGQPECPSLSNCTCSSAWVWTEMGEDAGCRGPTEELPQPPFAGGRAGWYVGLSLAHFGPGMCKAFPVGSQIILMVTQLDFYSHFSVKLFGPGLLFAGSFFIIASIPLVEVCLFRFFDSS